MMVRGAGLEPARHCWRQDLNLVRLPISPPAHDNQQLIKTSAVKQVVSDSNREQPGKPVATGI